MIPPDELDATAWLKTLVACPSVNPRGQPVTEAPFGEARLNSMLGAVLQRWGASVEFIEESPGRTVMIARFRGRDNRRRLMLEAHADTVPVDGMTIDPFTPRIENGRLYGRGACDTKGALAAMLSGLGTVLAQDGELPTSVCLVTTCNEEQGATGAKTLMQSGFRADAAIVGEPTDLRIVDTHKGVVRYRLTVRGRAAHSSDPSRGINAISKTAAIIRRIDGPLSAELACNRHPRLGPPVISVGTIRGGFLVNIIPDQCVIEIDRRLIPGETAAMATAQLQQHLSAVVDEEAPLDYTLEESQHYAPLESDPQSEFGHHLVGALTEVTGEAATAAAPWGSDAGAFHEADIPVFVFGPGSIQQAHSADEYVPLEAVQTAARVYAALIRRFR